MTGSRGRGRRSSTESGEDALVAEGVDVLESCLWDHADELTHALPRQWIAQR